MNKISNAAIFFFFLIFIVANPSKALEIVYPEDEAQINAYTTFFVGNADKEAAVRINNENVKVYPNGGFVHVTKLKPGKNAIKIIAVKENSKKELEYTIFTPEYTKTLPKYPLKINKDSVMPKQSVVYKPGDKLHVSFMGSTGNKAYFSIGNKRKNIPMYEQPPKYIRTQPVYGKSIKSSSIPVKGIYKGTYRIQDKDMFSNEIIKVSLLSSKDRETYTPPVTVSTIPVDYPPIIAVVKNDEAVVRTYPGKSRLTPLPEGTVINVTGRIGDNFRFKLGDNLDGWITEEDITVLPQGTPFYESYLNLIDILSDERSVYIKIPLEQKHPFIIEQPSPSEMYLKIFEVKANIDLFSYENVDKFIKEVKWTQDTKDSVKINIKTNSKQFWGYKYYYENDTLVLELKKPPVINPDKPLENIIICIDPGHGGEEDGAKGPTNIPEKQVNLEISNKLKTMLEQKGAKVIMTRTKDEEVDLYERVDIANYNDAQILLSIHNNSLPDGRNPYKEHGTSTYYYHSQALPLAKILHKALLEDLQFNDFGIFWSSFVLTRPHEPLSVLLELGFMINPEEYALLNEPEFQDKIAESITRGLAYFMFVNSESAK